MTVYVDEPIWPWRGKRWCHMTADTHEELHAFAKRLGLQRAWFQDKDHHQHYDLTTTKHRLAIELGAVEVSCRDYVHIYRTLEINMGWGKLEEEYDLDRALGYSHEEIVERARARFLEWKADRALELPPKRQRRRSRK